MENEMKKKSPVISVIVPVYKVEPYLRCCIDSILAQTFQDFELILVDDGSPDNCGAICDEYAAKDDRIVVIHQKNGGLSAARNAGLDWVFANSNSEWITFVDSDDYVVSVYLEKLFAYTTDRDVDIVCTAFTPFLNEKELPGICCDVISAREVSGREACIGVYQENDTIRIEVPGKLYRKAMLSKIRFPLGKIHEDQEFVPKAMFSAGKIIALRAWLYGYRRRPDSITTQSFSVRRYDNIDALDSCIRHYIAENDLELARIAEKRKERYLSLYTFTAWRTGVLHTVPEKCRMSLTKALWISLIDNLRRGGVKAVWSRIMTLMGILKNKIIKR